MDLTAAEMSSPPLATVAAAARDFAAALSDLAATVAARAAVAYGNAERSRRGTLVGATLAATRVVAALTATLAIGAATWVVAMHDGGKQQKMSRLRAAFSLYLSLSGVVLAARTVLALLHWCDGVCAKLHPPPKPRTHKQGQTSQAGIGAPSADVDHHPSPVDVTGTSWSPLTPSSSTATTAEMFKETDSARLTALVELYADDTSAETTAKPGDAGLTDATDLAALVNKYADLPAGEELASISPPVASR